MKNSSLIICRKKVKDVFAVPYPKTTAEFEYLYSILKAGYIDFHDDQMLVNLRKGGWTNFSEGEMLVFYRYDGDYFIPNKIMSTEMFNNKYQILISGE